MNPAFIKTLSGRILTVLGVAAIACQPSPLQAQTTQWSTNGGNVWYAPSTVNVGIGTSSPQYRLEVAGPVVSNAFGIQNVLSFDPGNAVAVLGTISQHPVQLWTNAAARMTILQNGDVGIGTTAPNFRLESTERGIFLA